MATRRLSTEGDEKGTATFDAGAQYFTVRSQRFESWVTRWLEAGLVEEWSRGFATPDASAYRDGHPRYRGHGGMRTIPKALAEPLDVHFNNTVGLLHYDGHWQVESSHGNYEAEILLLTPPVPLTLALLDKSGVKLEGETRQALDIIDYEPCFALLVLLDGPSGIPEPGGLWPGSQAISWMADNQQKGISSVPALTIHGSPEFSKEHFDDDPEEVATLLLKEAGRWLGSGVSGYEMRLWPYSIPVHMHSEATLFNANPGPLAFAGDAFAGPRVEGAALSGLAAADAILQYRENKP